MLRRDATRPRLTFYDDADGPTRGERIELSAKVLANWVAKGANLLQDELDGAPATTVGLDLPAHWRSIYWALAAWAVGSTVVVGSQADRSDVVVTTRPEVAGRALTQSGGAVLVTLAMLARGNADTPSGVVDEARELASQGDVFAPWEEPEPGATALVTERGEHTYAEVVLERADWGLSPRVSVAGTLEEVLRAALSAWAANGSVVLVRDPSGDQSARLAAEGVTLSSGRP